MLNTSEQRAIQRALARGGASAVTRVRYGLYRVESNSRPGTFHTVSVDARGQYRCDCQAGLAGKPCWHKAAVFVAKVEHTSGSRVTGPRPLRDESPAPAVKLTPGGFPRTPRKQVALV